MEIQLTKSMLGANFYKLAKDKQQRNEKAAGLLLKLIDEGIDITDSQIICNKSGGHYTTPKIIGCKNTTGEFCTVYLPIPSKTKEWRSLGETLVDLAQNSSATLSPHFFVKDIGLKHRKTKKYLNT